MSAPVWPEWQDIASAMKSPRRQNDAVEAGMAVADARLRDTGFDPADMHMRQYARVAAQNAVADYAEALAMNLPPPPKERT